jgi:CRISPR/Cas system-associated exonuclease Cas4 (RecB family)
MNISQSQINLFRKCPYAYALRYLYKKESIMFDPSIVEVGSRVHDAIDMYYRNYLLLNGTEEDIRNKVYEILRNQWDTTLSVDYLKKAYTCVCNFAKFENTMRKGRRGVPLTECKIYCNGLMGIVDYLDLNKPNIVDFKTNTKAGVGYDNKVQAVMYKMLVKQEYDIDLPYFTLQFLFPNETRVIKYEENVLQIQREIENSVEQIRKAWDTKNFPKEPRTPSTCNGCEYRFFCGGLE